MKYGTGWQCSTNTKEFEMEITTVVVKKMTDAELDHYYEWGDVRYDSKISLIGPGCINPEERKAWDVELNWFKSQSRMGKIAVLTNMETEATRRHNLIHGTSFRTYNACRKSLGKRLME